MLNTAFVMTIMIYNAHPYTFSKACNVKVMKLYKALCI